MTITAPAITIGWLIALLVLVLVIVLFVISRLDPVVAAFIGGLALARLIP